MPRIGLFGGTFDPIHNGHLHIARSFADELDLESVILLPAGDPYHKTAPRTAAHHRLAMAEIAAQADSRLAVSDCDIIRQGATYTHDTVQIFRQHFPAAELWLLIGMDSLLQLHTWHRWQNLVRQCRIAAAPRPGRSLAQAPAPLQNWLAEALPQGRLHILQAEPLPISSIQIRQQLATQHTSPIIPPEVLGYIRQHQLYCHTGA